MTRILFTLLALCLLLGSSQAALVDPNTALNWSKVINHSIALYGNPLLNVSNITTLETNIDANSTKVTNLETWLALNATKANNALTWLGTNATDIDLLQSTTGSDHAENFTMANATPVKVRFAQLTHYTICNVSPAAWDNSIRWIVYANNTGYNLTLSSAGSTIGGYVYQSTNQSGAYIGLMPVPAANDYQIIGESSGDWYGWTPG